MSLLRSKTNNSPLRGSSLAVNGAQKYSEIRSPLPVCASLMAQMVKNLPAIQETQVRFLSWEDPLKTGMATHSSILAWKIPWTEKPGGYSPWGCKESDTTEWLNTPPTCLSKQTGVFLIMPLFCHQRIFINSTPIYIWICSLLPCFSRIPPAHDPRPSYLSPGWLQQPPQWSLCFYLVPPSTKTILHSENRTLFKGTKKIISFPD